MENLQKPEPPFKLRTREELEKADRDNSSLSHGGHWEIRSREELEQRDRNNNNVDHLANAGIQIIDTKEDPLSKRGYFERSLTPKEIWDLNEPKKSQWAVSNEEFGKKSFKESDDRFDVLTKQLEKPLSPERSFVLPPRLLSSLKSFNDTKTDGDENIKLLQEELGKVSSLKEVEQILHHANGTLLSPYQVDEALRSSRLPGLALAPKESEILNRLRRERVNAETSSETGNTESLSIEDEEVLSGLRGHIETLISMGHPQLKFLREDLKDVTSVKEAKQKLDNLSYVFHKLDPEDLDILLNFFDQPAEVLAEEKIAEEEEQEKVIEAQEVSAELEREEESTENVINLVTAVSAENTDESLEKIDDDLRNARAEYASQMIDFKNKTREKKGKFAKVMSDLGVHDKQMPEKDMPTELLSAKKAYIAAKKKKYEIALKVDRKIDGERTIAGQIIPGTEYFVNQDVVELAEKEYAAFQKTIIESMPPLEKGRITKTFEKWAKLPPYQRIALSTTLMTGVALVTGGIAGLVGAASYAGYKGTRSVLGAISSQRVGKYVDGVYKEKNEKSRADLLKEYGQNIDLDNFEEKERTFMEALAKEEKTAKQQRLMKAGAMVATSGITSVGFGSLQGAFMGSPDVVHADSGGFSPKPIVMEDVRIKADGLPPTEATVKVSSSGFIKTIDDMKAKLIEQYGGEKNVPQEIKTNILNKTSTELAQKFGFYDAKNNLSGVALKGDELEVDSKGQVYLDHGGKRNLINEGEHKFQGKMVGPKSENIKTYEDVPAEADMHPDIEKTEASGPDNDGFENGDEATTPPKTLEGGGGETPDGENPPDPKFNHLYNEHETTPVSKPESFETELGNKYEIATVGSEKIIKMDDIVIAHGSPDVRGVYSIPLDDRFQNGEEYAVVREAYANAMNRFDQNAIGKVVIPVPFESGLIQIAKGENYLAGNPDTVRVLLNGKEIAHGMMGDNGPEMIFDKNLKSGILFKDNAYERAFKTVKPILKTLKK